MAARSGSVPRGGSENVRVVLRVRPLTRKEADRGEDELIRDEVRLGSQWAVGCELWGSGRN